jgi:hypothetical protein
MLSGEQPFQQPLVHTTAEANLAVDFDHWDTFVVLLAKGRVRVDIHLLGGKALAQQNLPGIIAQMAALSRIEDYVAV